MLVCQIAKMPNCIEDWFSSLSTGEHYTIFLHKNKQFNYFTFRWVELDHGERRSENRIFSLFPLYNKHTL